MAESLIAAITTHPDKHFIVEVLVLLLIIFKCNMLYNFSSSETNRDIMSILLQNLAIKDGSAYQIVSSSLFITYEKSVGDILNMLISNAVNKYIPPITAWIFTVPLVHFLMKKCVPFDHLQRISWDLIDLYHESR